MKTNRIIILVIGLLIGGILFLVSCQETDDNSDDNTPILPTLSNSESEVISSANAFSMAIFKRINDQHPGDNLFISPFSISTALSMTMNGAAGETKSDMKNTLALGGLTDEEINQAYSDLSSFLLNLDKKVTLKIVNSNWYSSDLNIKQEFHQILLDYYDAEVNAADFSNSATKDQINEWISDNTNGKIKNMLDAIPADAVMYLINAIYFKADWTFKFDESKTANAAFALSDSSEILVPTMFASDAEIGYSLDEDYEVIDIPYGNQQYRFTIVRHGSNSVKTPDEILEGLNSGTFSSMMESVSIAKLDIYMPKFKIEFKELLNDILIDMGMGSAFANADFSNLFQESTDLVISRVIHQSFLEVNEEGSEAAAATVVEVGVTSAGPPSIVRIDEPFVFFIREKHSNTILFAGKLLDPR